MTSVNWNTGALPEAYAPLVSPKAVGSGTTSSSAAPAQPADTLRLSPAAVRELALAGRIALNEQAGNISSELAAQLNGQTSEIQDQIVADEQNNGGTLTSSEAQSIQQLQTQESQRIYSAAHDGAAAPTDPDVTKAGIRQDVQAGRIATSETAGNLSSDQANQLYAQSAMIQQQIVTDEQANGGSLSSADAQAINQAQNQFSQQIYETAHSASTPASA
jgi:hypothetical protein